jgi:fatty acid desaturase
MTTTGSQTGVARRRPDGARAVRQSGTRHALITALMLGQTLGVLAGLSLLALVVHAPGGPLAGEGWRSALRWCAAGVVLAAQALWFERLYLVGHEAAHRKLVPGSGWANDLLGQLMLLPIGFPVTVYRTVHLFHHAANRRNARDSALDVFAVRGPITRATRVRCHTVWYLGVFAGGFFVHSVLSVVVFLCVPIRYARRISPAFLHWSVRLRLRSWAQLAGCLGLHAVVWAAAGPQVYLWVLGYPFLAFAWLWSLLLYAFHFGTTMGPQTRFHVRRVSAGRIASWIVLDFTEHPTHHADPRLHWYQLKERRRQLPPPFAEVNREAPSLWRAAFGQLAGPTIVAVDGPLPSRLFVRWED